MVTPRLNIFGRQFDLVETPKGFELHGMRGGRSSLQTFDNEPNYYRVYPFECFFSKVIFERRTASKWVVHYF